jgi:hypothetical protein
MASRLFTLVVATATGVAACHAGPSPSAKQIVVEPFGNCPKVSLDETNKASVVIDQACHGWSVEQCSDMLYFRRIGVVSDTAVVVTGNGRRVDVGAAINTELGHNGDEYLHLQFLQPVCEANGLELPFAGSRITRRQTGSADELRGEVFVTESAAAVTIER